MFHGWHTEIIKNRFHALYSMAYISHCCAKYLILNFHLLKYRFSLVTVNHNNFGKVFFFLILQIYTIYLYILTAYTILYITNYLYMLSIYTILFLVVTF